MVLQSSWKHVYFLLLNIKYWHFPLGIYTFSCTCSETFNPKRVELRTSWLCCKDLVSYPRDSSLSDWLVGSLAGALMPLGSWSWLTKPLSYWAIFKFQLPLIQAIDDCYLVENFLNILQRILVRIPFHLQCRTSVFLLWQREITQTLCLHWFRNQHWSWCCSLLLLHHTALVCQAFLKCFQHCNPAASNGLKTVVYFGRIQIFMYILCIYCVVMAWKTVMLNIFLQIKNFSNKLRTIFVLFYLHIILPTCVE